MTHYAVHSRIWLSQYGKAVYIYILLDLSLEWSAQILHFNKLTAKIDDQSNRLIPRGERSCLPVDSINTQDQLANNDTA